MLSIATRTAKPIDGASKKRELPNDLADSRLTKMYYISKWDNKRVMRWRAIYQAILRHFQPGVLTKNLSWLPSS